MGVLPTKGLTLPLMSYGRSSLIVALAWVGLLLRVYHEAERQRGAARATVRERAHEPARCSSWRAAPAATCSRRWRSRGCCASSRWKWSGSAPRAGSRRASIPAEGIPIEQLSVGGLRGKGLVDLARGAVPAELALLQALAVMRRHRPLVVVGLGGFVTGPGGVAAWLTRRPLVIHEQNAIAGFTNRCLAHLARQVLEAFPGSFGRDVHARVIGNPVRARHQRAAAAAARFAGRIGPMRILVIGGSQGATRLNAVVPFALEAPLAQARLRRAPPGGRALDRCGPRELRAGGRARRRASLHRGHERGVRLGGPGDLPRRRAHGIGARGGGRRRDPRALSRARSTITRPTTRSTWCARAPRC